MNQELATAVRQAATLQEKVDLLKDAYAGQDCWIIACGPTATAIDKAVLKEALADKLVIAVKQAYDLLPDIVDFHVVNPCALKAYKYSETPPIRVAVIWLPGSDAWDARWDLSFRIPRCNQMRESVCWTKQFAKWELANSLDRPWGPGIMHEIGFYLPVHLGCKRIFTLGFDFEPGVGKHFYEDRTWSMEVATVTVPVNATGALREWLETKGVKWYRIATAIGSQIPAPTMSFEQAVGA